MVTKQGPKSPYRGKPYGWHNRFLFGKYYGKTVSEIWQDDPHYLLWVIDNVDAVEFTPEVLLEIDDWTSSELIPF